MDEDGSTLLCDGGLTKVDADGTVDWSVSFPDGTAACTALAVGFDGSVYVAGGGYLASYGTDGTERWWVSPPAPDADDVYRVTGYPVEDWIGGQDYLSLLGVEVRGMAVSGSDLILVGNQRISIDGRRGPFNTDLFGIVVRIDATTGDAFLP